MAINELQFDKFTIIITIELNVRNIWARKIFKSDFSLFFFSFFSLNFGYEVCIIKSAPSILKKEGAAAISMTLFSFCTTRIWVKITYNLILWVTYICKKNKIKIPSYSSKTYYNKDVYNIFRDPNFSVAYVFLIGVSEKQGCGVMGSAVQFLRKSVIFWFLYNKLKRWKKYWSKSVIFFIYLRANIYYPEIFNHFSISKSFKVLYWHAECSFHRIKWSQIKCT